MEAWRYHSLSIQSNKESYHPNLSCNVKLAEQEDDMGDYTKMSVLNMSFPILIFFVGAILAIIVHFSNKKNGESVKKNLRRLSTIGSKGKNQIPGQNDDFGENSLDADSASMDGSDEGDLFVTTRGNIDSIAGRVQELIEEELAKEKTCV